MFHFTQNLRFGYIDFKHPESVKKAMELNNKIVEGRRIFVVTIFFIMIWCENNYKIRIMKLEKQRKAIKLIWMTMETRNITNSWNFISVYFKFMKKNLERKQSLKRKSRRKKRRRKQLLKSKTSTSRKNTLKKSFRYLIKNLHKLRLPSKFIYGCSLSILVFEWIFCLQRKGLSKILWEFSKCIV